MASSGRLGVDARSFGKRVTGYGFEWPGIGDEHLVAFAALPVDAGRRDPFDRLPVAQSRVEPQLVLAVDA